MEKEKYISIVNLFWKVLFAWRAILLGALIFAIIVPVFTYVNDRTDYEKKVNAMLEKSAEDEVEIMDYTEKESLIKQLEMYEQVAFYNNANPTKVYTDILEFVSFNKMTTDQIHSYVDYLYSDHFAEEVLKNQTINEEEVVAYILAVQDVIEVSYSVLADGKIQMYIYIDYADGCTIGNTDLYYKDLVAIVKEHLLKDNVFSLVSHNIEKMELADLKKIKDSIYSTVYDWQYAYDIQKNEAQSKNVETIEVPEFSYKLIIVGGLLGIILVCVCVFVKELFTNRLQDIEEISDFYEIQTLGVVQCETLEKKKNKIDSFLYGLKNQHVMNSDDAIKLAITNVKVLCDKSGIKDLYISSSEAITGPLVLEEYKKIVEGIRKQGINAIEGQSVLVNAQAYLDMCEVGTVLFVETVERSRCKNIEAEIQKVQESQISVLGCVVLF